MTKMNTKSTDLFAELLRTDFMTFVEAAFSELNPGTEFVDSPHLAILAAALARCESGECRRLMICIKPRSLKSIMASVAFPAWILGRDPTKQIICASYGQDLADKHARDTRKLMASPLYQRVFATRISPLRNSVSEFETTRHGFRKSTSVEGPMTGRGADIIIIDDPIKPDDAQSETIRKSVNDWYDSVLLSRLNDKQKGVIILVMQRVHQNDLMGHIHERENWEVLRLPAIAEEDEIYHAQTPFGPIEFRRKAGEALDPEREPLDILNQLRQSMSTYTFEAQYQQNPQPVGGAIIKNAWIRYYKPVDIPQQFAWKDQSWDTASKSGELNDYSVCTTWGVLNNHYYLLDVFRRRLEYPELRRAAKEQYHRYRPRRVLIEDKGSGIQLLQDLRVDGIPIASYSPPPGHDKQMRLSNQSALFESGRVLLPDGAPWVEDYVRELTTFPGSKYDDQVDSTTQALDYIAKQSQYSCRVTELRL